MYQPGRGNVFPISSMTRTITPQFDPAKTATPPPEATSCLFEFFVVQGVGFQCVAYRDHDGRWRNASNNEELRGDISILE